MKINLDFGELKRISGNEYGMTIAHKYASKYEEITSENEKIIFIFNEKIENVAPSFVNAFIGSIYEADKSLLNRIEFEGSIKIVNRFVNEIKHYKELND